MVKIYFGLLKNQVKFLKSRGFLAFGLSTYDFSTLYTTLPHSIIKEKLTELIEQTFNIENSLYLACNDKNAFFKSEQPKRYKFWSCQKMCDAFGLSTYDFSTLYTTLPYNFIKEKLTELIEQTFNREGSLYLTCNDKNAFFTSEQPKRYKLWSCQKMCDALHYLLDHIFLRFGSKLHRQIVGIPMGTNCAPLVADLFLFCYERDFMLSLSDNDQTDIIEAFNSTSRYLDDLINIDNPYFEQMVGQIYPTELQLNKANSFHTEAPFLDLNLSITNGIVSSKIYDKRDDFNFEIVNFPFS